MRNDLFAGIGVMSVIILLIGFLLLGGDIENSRLERKCLVEFQDLSHKEAIEKCKERVK